MHSFPHAAHILANACYHNINFLRTVSLVYSSILMAVAVNPASPRHTGTSHLQALKAVQFHPRFTRGCEEKPGIPRGSF